MSLLTYTADLSLLAGATIQGSVIQANFTDVATLANGQLRGENMAADAGLVSGQLSDRFYTFPREIQLVGEAAGDIDAAPAPITVTATSGVTRKRYRVRCRPGKQLYLASVSVWAFDVGVEAVYVQIFRNGTAIAGMLFELTADNTFVEVANALPFTNLAQPFSDGDIVEYQMYSATGTGTIALCNATEEWKAELGT
jgi:hypothetical protein